MIVWGVLTEQAIGKIFIAGVIPGLLLVLMFCGYVAWVARMRPHLVGERPRAAQLDRHELVEQPNGPTPASGITAADAAVPLLDPPLMRVLWSTLAVIALVLGTLGGIWLGFFTPTEGAGVGAALALLLAIAKGLRTREIYQVILSVGRTSAPLLLLLFCAQLYSRVLSMTGITNSAKEVFLGSGLTPLMVLAVMVGIWFLLGCLIDSISIILLTVPVFAPIAEAVGFDPLAFAVIGILAIETGLITPPFGILVFTVRAALPTEATVGEIFRAAIPYWFCLLLLIVLIALYPALATWLPNAGTALKPA
jgi:TRAP-type C4-dicarboxylate transport system permease large subunit